MGGKGGGFTQVAHEHAWLQGSRKVGAASGDGPRVAGHQRIIGL